MKEIPAELRFGSRYRPELEPFPRDPEWLFELGMWPHWLWLDVDLEFVRDWRCLMKVLRTQVGPDREEP